MGGKAGDDSHWDELDRCLIALAGSVERDEPELTREAARRACLELEDIVARASTGLSVATPEALRAVLAQVRQTRDLVMALSDLYAESLSNLLLPPPEHRHPGSPYAVARATVPTLRDWQA